LGFDKLSSNGVGNQVDLAGEALTLPSTPAKG
jgi:hypothetical protein